ncbi:MAG: hypothetical protein WA989_11145 [Henriciella sp.]|uniref:hypothetical protein n=1 Tax=Henriciella sp. TaxID=1968823 RepID=UPI003C724D1A
MPLNPRHLLCATSLLLASTSLSACMTQPQPCTPEWVEWRTDKVLSRFARANYGTVNDLRSLSGKVDNPSALTALRIASLIDDFDDLARDFDRIVMPELNNAIAQCSQPQNFVPAFTGFLRDEGVGEDVIEWVEVIGYIAMEQYRS